MSDALIARRVTARFIRDIVKKASMPPEIAGELESLAMAVEAGEEISAWKPRRRQRGKKKRERQKRYRQTKQKSRRQSQKWRKRNPSKVKRYERKRRRQPQRHRLRRAMEGVPFWDLEHGAEGEVVQVNPEQESLQAMVEGQPKEYGVFSFLDETVFTSPEGETEFFDTLDQAWDARDLAELEGGGEMDRQAKALSVIWLVSDVPPARTYKGPQWEEAITKMTVPQFVNYVGKMRGRWEQWNFALHADEASAVKDAKARLERWHSRYDIAL